MILAQLQTQRSRRGGDIQPDGPQRAAAFHALPVEIQDREHHALRLQVEDRERPDRELVVAGDDSLFPPSAVEDSASAYDQEILQ